jgi:hypothetical protein
MYYQHPKGFTILFIEVFVMHFMRPPDGADINIIAACKEFESLVDDDLMHHKVREPIEHYSKANGLYPPHGGIQCAPQNHADTWNSENHKKPVVFFKKTRTLSMVIFMQVPEKAVHYIPMSEPGNRFHDEEGKQNNAKIN